MRYISIHQHPEILHINYIHSLVPGRLAEITNSKNIDIFQHALFHHGIVTFVGIFQRFPFKTYAVQLQAIVQKIAFVFNAVDFNGFC